jgi:hypothetical protein
MRYCSNIEYVLGLRVTTIEEPFVVMSPSYGCEFHLQAPQNPK